MDMRTLLIGLLLSGIANYAFALSCMEPLQGLKNSLERHPDLPALSGSFEAVSIGKFGKDAQNFQMWDPNDPSSSQDSDTDISVFLFSGEVHKGGQIEIFHDLPITIKRLCHGAWGCGVLPQSETRFITLGEEENGEYSVIVSMCPTMIEDTKEARELIGLQPNSK